MKRELKRNQQIIRPDRRLFKECKKLRHAVEHPNEESDIILQQGVYKQKDLEAVKEARVDGVVVGYKVKPCSPLVINPYFDRYAYIKVPGHRLTDLSKKEMSAVKTAVLEAFFEHQQGEVHIEVIGYDAILLWQRFMVAFPIKVGDNFTVVGEQIGHA
jgi:hypothetical protein